MGSFVESFVGMTGVLGLSDLCPVLAVNDGSMQLAMQPTAPSESKPTTRHQLPSLSRDELDDSSRISHIPIFRQQCPNKLVILEILRVRTAIIVVSEHGSESWHFLVCEKLPGIKKVAEPQTR